MRRGGEWECLTSIERTELAYDHLRGVAAAVLGRLGYHLGACAGALTGDDNKNVRMLVSQLPDIMKELEAGLAGAHARRWALTPKEEK